MLELPGNGGIPPTAVVSPYTLQWAALWRLGVVSSPTTFFLNSTTARDGLKTYFRKVRSQEIVGRSWSRSRLALNIKRLVSSRSRALVFCLQPTSHYFCQFFRLSQQLIVLIKVVQFQIFTTWCWQFYT